MSVPRALFIGTHLENAPDWLLEIELLFHGGWTARRWPQVRKEKSVEHDAGSIARSPGRGRLASVTPQYSVDRSVRIAEPRAAPRPGGAVRHHHFEQRTILAARKGVTSVVERRAAYCEGYNDPTGIIAIDGRAAGEASYIEGGKSTEAERVVYVVATNGETYGERMRFWNLANENAHFVGDHTISVSTPGVEQAWDRACKDPTMPEMLREAVAKARASTHGAATITVNDAGVVKRWLNKRTQSFPQELQPHLTLETPHNGRVGYSVIGQFHHDMSLAGMRSSLDKLVDEFKVRNIPCVAVIHEPTAKNSKKNWHFHLIYYAGPAELLPDGRWSFERVPERDKWGTMKSVPLKRLGRNEEVAAADWVPKLKQRWSDIVNAQAAAEGIRTRFTNETNEKRGLQKAQTRYTPGRQALHKQGYFTDAEIGENIASWRNREQLKRQNLANILLPVRQTLERLSADRRQAVLGPADRRTVNDQLLRCQSMLSDADALADAAAKALTMREMIVSGPNDVLDHYGGVDVALGEKKATPSRVKKRSFAQTVCAAAQSYLAEQEPILKRLAEIQHVALSRFEALRATLDDSMATLDARIDNVINARAQSTDRLEDGRVAQRRREAELAARRDHELAHSRRISEAGDAPNALTARQSTKSIRAEGTPPDAVAASGGNRIPATPEAIDPAGPRREILANSSALRRKLTDRWKDRQHFDNSEIVAVSPSVQAKPKPSWLIGQLGPDFGR